MTAMTTVETARQQLAHVLHFTRTSNIWRRDGNTWTDGDGSHNAVTWLPARRTLSLVRVDWTGRRLGADVQVGSIREALDVLAALNLLPYFMAPAYRDGSADGATTQGRVDHEHYNKMHGDTVRELTDVIVDMGALIDRVGHDDSLDGCDACALINDLDGETVARIRTEADAKTMAADLTATVSRERAAAEMKTSLLRTLTTDQLAGALAETLLQLTDHRPA